jgi:hypothetical protein
MGSALENSPDWFDAWWEQNQTFLPIWIRGQKKAARQVLAGLITAMGQQATTPEGVRVILAFGKIASIVKGARGVLDSPNPTPEEVTVAVERLVQKVKP